MRIYEELFIVKHDTPEEEINQLVDQLTQVITSNKGTVEKVERWGVRKLAYRIGKRDEGFYILFQFSAPPDTVKELERRLRVADAVIKYLTVRIDEKLKRIEKRKKQREKRAQKRPAPPVSTPGDPMAEQMLARAAAAEASEEGHE